MGCTSCATGTNGQPKGCRNNGTCGTDACNKLTVFNWLSNLSLPVDMEPFNAVEVRFKNGRKHFYKTNSEFSVAMGDVVVTEAEKGYDVGVVSLTGELVRVQMQKKKESLDTDKLPEIYRKATQQDVDKWQGLREKEPEVQKRSREIAMHLGLEMKISDVEFQGDGSKATFYYTAEGRVDFRELIKDLARAFHIRIEMKQIGYRQEAARLGGIGSCGRELCCSTWLTDFRSVSTSAARYQQLALNPQKLAGQCGKLKCCLNYELDTYLEALDFFPKLDTKIKTEKGLAMCQKVDVFRNLMWYSYVENGMKWHEISVEKVKEMIAKNEKGELIQDLEDYAEPEETPNSLNFNETGGLDSLTRFDTQKKPQSKRRNQGKRRRRRGRGNPKATKASSNRESNTRNSKRSRGRGRGNNPNSNKDA